jgi:hypothetical protein
VDERVDPAELRRGALRPGASGLGVEQVDREGVAPVVADAEVGGALVGEHRMPLGEG